MSFLFLTLSEVLAIHESRLAKYGGSTGIRYLGLLESAIAMPQASFGGEFLHSDVFTMAAAYLFHLSLNHPFIDGNKRTALAACLVFLEINGYELTADEQALEKLVIETATGKLTKNNIAKFLQKNSRKK